MIRYITNQKVEIDIHQMTRDQARSYICKYLDRVNGGVKEVVIIHGYSSGTVLKEMVQRMKHPKIKNRMLSLNPGVTTFFLK